MSRTDGGVSGTPATGPPGGGHHGEQGAHRRHQRDETGEQLQAALNSRVVIEQAKGKLAERTGLDMDQAFTLLRQHARNTNQRLTDVARYVIDSPTADFPPPPRW